MEDILEARIRSHIDAKQVRISGDGNRFEIRVTSSAFEGMTRVQRQQMVYEAIGDLIRDGSVHAVTILANVGDEA
jgi:acid stress-induced BolA-like protein IbaG/YrbA